MQPFTNAVLALLLWEGAVQIRHSGLIRLGSTKLSSNSGAHFQGGTTYHANHYSERGSDPYLAQRHMRCQAQRADFYQPESTLLIGLPVSCAQVPPSLWWDR